jgi:lipopolysaccharide export LptBFGC system permease protein LptF
MLSDEVIFVIMFLLILGLTMLVLGIFAAYFGSGKVRSFGTGLGVSGIVVWLITYLVGRGFHASLSYVIYNGILYLVSAIIGAVIALLIFLAVLLKT